MTLRVLSVLVVAGLLGSPTFAQPADTSSTSVQAVRATIDSLFDGMRAGDSTKVRAVFHENARLSTALGPSDPSTVRMTPVDTFVTAVGRPHEKVWDERVWNVEIRVDGPLASAWVPYAFYHGSELSHCGVNAITFVREANGWSILSVTDTRRSDCEVPVHVRK